MIKRCKKRKIKSKTLSKVMILQNADLEREREGKKSAKFTFYIIV